jgi:hypothetical protein
VSGIQSIEIGRRVLGFRQITGLSSAKGCPLANGSAVMFRPMAQAIRYRLDGVAPTASIGMHVAVGECVWFVGDLTKLSFIEVTSGATIDLHVFE